MCIEPPRAPAGQFVVRNESLRAAAELIDSRHSWRELLVGVATRSWLASMVFHTALMIVLALILGTLQVAKTIGLAREFEAASVEDCTLPSVIALEVGRAGLAPVEFSADRPAFSEIPFVEPAQIFENSLRGDDPPSEIARGDQASRSGHAFDFTRTTLGPMIMGVGRGADASQEFPGANGPRNGFDFRRGPGSGPMSGPGGGTKQSERAVTAALSWIARHQNKDGSWSIKHTHNCKGGFCSWPGEQDSDCAATAMGLLPFLAAGQTHESQGPYQTNIRQGINWLLKVQRPTGDLTAGSQSQMYSHGLATIALCEAYGMTQDQRVGYAAQAAINFIESGQNREGGWRYRHGSDDSDTSVFGWMVMALKSGQMAGLKVNPDGLKACQRYLDACARGNYKCEFSYTPGGGPTYPMTSVGLLTAQYLGAKRDDPIVANGVDYLLTRKPDITQRNTYYWYYATQAMHNVPGPQWDEWNRHMRRILIETQDTNGCAAGSWNPQEPEPDPWGRQGGRLMVTSLSALTLEVYYRYLPLYKFDEAQKDATKAQ